MTLWTIAFDATLAVRVEAESEEQALRVAERLAWEFEREAEGTSCPADFSLGRVFLIRNQETGEEVCK
jgi:hypothetical protein